jgi:hypothetical protein
MPETNNVASRMTNQVFENIPKFALSEVMFEVLIRMFERCWPFERIIAG